MPKNAWGHQLDSHIGGQQDVQSRLPFFHTFRFFNLPHMQVPDSAESGGPFPGMKLPRAHLFSYFCLLVYCLVSLFFFASYLSFFVISFKKYPLLEVPILIGELPHRLACLHVLPICNDSFHVFFICQICSFPGCICSFYFFLPCAIFASFQRAFCFSIFSAIVMTVSFRLACSNSIQFHCFDCFDCFSVFSRWKYITELRVN